MLQCSRLSSVIWLCVVLKKASCEIVNKNFNSFVVAADSHEKLNFDAKECHEYLENKKTKNWKCWMART
jgi:hypothetical protein